MTFGISLRVFSVTRVMISRQNQRQKMEQKQKMGHQGAVVHQGKTIIFPLLLVGAKCTKNVFQLCVFFSVDFSRPPKKNFVEVTELTDITYMSNLVKLRPGHMNIVLVLTDASKNILLSKFAKEVYSFTG